MSSQRDRTARNPCVRWTLAHSSLWWVGALVAIVTFGPLVSWAMPRDGGEWAASPESAPQHVEPNATPDRVPAPVPQTGQDITYGERDDGELQKGVPWPSPRFPFSLDGTVKDRLTGLIWLKNANCFGEQEWDDALASANLLSHGQCGLTDGSEEGDWRLPNLRELQSLIDYGEFFPALPAGSPFEGVVTVSFYWSSTTLAGSSISAWGVALIAGKVNPRDKTIPNFVWPVRGGQ